jgi:predicted dehydrogenase
VATAVLQFEGGCVATITASRLTQSKIRTLTITQESAYILLDFSTQDIDIHRQATSAYLMTREELKYRQESFVEKIFVHKDNPLRQEHIHFVKCVRGQETPIVSGASDIRTIEIASRILTQIHGHHP